MFFYRLILIRLSQSTHCVWQSQRTVYCSVISREDGFSQSTHVFKSDRGVLSVKESREMLLTTRSSSEKFTLVLS